MAVDDGSGGGGGGGGGWGVEVPEFVRRGSYAIFVRLWRVIEGLRVVVCFFLSSFSSFLLLVLGSWRQADDHGGFKLSLQYPVDYQKRELATDLVTLRSKM
jgi:hypothetical protein